MQLWDVDSQEEIIRFLDSIPRDAFGCARQKHTNGIELTFELVDLKVKDEKLFFQSTLPFDFDPNLPVTLEVIHLGINFSILPGQWKNEGKGISSAIPKKIKVSERRVEKRRSFHNEKIHIKLRAHRGKTVAELDGNIADMSAHGLRIVLGEDQDFFFRSSVFEVLEVNGSPCEEKGMLVPKHVSMKGKFFHLGLYAENGFTQRFLELLSKPIKKELGEKELKALKDEFDKLI